VKQALDVANSGDSAHSVLDLAQALFIVYDSAENDDSAVSVDADLSLGDGPVAEQLALDLAHQPDVVELRYVVVTVRDRAREPDHLPGLIVCLALDPPAAATNRAHGAVAYEVSPAFAAARIEEELKHGPSGQRANRACGQLTRRGRACAFSLATRSFERWVREQGTESPQGRFAESVHAILPKDAEYRYREVIARPR
jgi:hypothetical protein